MNAYYKHLVTNPTGVHLLADLIAFNDAHLELKKPVGYKDQSMYESIYYHPLIRSHRRIACTIART